MSSVKLVSLEVGKADIALQVNLDKRGSTGYGHRVTIRKCEQGWVADSKFDDMVPQESPEAALERLGLYYINLAKACKGKNIKHLNIDSAFKPKHFRR